MTSSGWSMTRAVPERKKTCSTDGSAILEVLCKVISPYSARVWGPPTALERERERDIPDASESACRVFFQILDFHPKMPNP